MVKCIRLAGLVTSLWLLAFVLGTEAKKSSSHESVPKPNKCKKHDSWFSDRKEYRYTYTGVVQSAITGTTESRSGFMFTCILTVTSPRKCEMTLKVKKCNLKERASSPNDPDDPFQELAESKAFSDQMSKNIVYFQMRGGLIDQKTIIIADDEPLEIINMKRGMLSALQLKMPTKELYTKPQTQMDIYGSCPVMFEKTDDSSLINSHRDMTRCSYPEIYWYQYRILSVVKELTGGLLKKNYTEVHYPFESNIDCSYKIKGSNLEMVTCFHHQAMIPFTYNGTIKAGAMTNVSQVLELDEVTAHKSKKIDRSLKSRHLITLEYAFEEKIGTATHEFLFDRLYEMRLAVKANEMDRIPALFTKFVDIIRYLPTETLKAAYDEMKSCNACDKESKAVMDTFMLDGLMSCGTPACVNEVARHIAETQIDSYAITIFLMDMALNYNSAIDSIVLNILEICKTKKTGTCLLLLSGVVRTYGAKLDKEELQNQEGAVYKTLKYFRDQLGENCKPGIFQNNPDNTEQLNQFLTTLKMAEIEALR